MITQSILSKMENHEPPKSKTVANQDVGENIFSDIFTRFTEIFFLLPVTGRRQPVWMDDKIVGSINNNRYYEYIPRGAPNPVLLMFCEVKRFPVQESEDTDTWISRKLPKTVLEQVGAELVTECFSSVFLPNILGVICMRTEVIFVYLTIASDHVKAIRNNEEIGNQRACIHYTEAFDIMKREDRKQISELLFWLGSCSAESEKVYVPEGDNVELKCPYFSTTTPVIWQNTRGLLFDGYEIAKKLTLRNKMKITGNNPPKIKLVAVPSAVVIEGSSVTLFCNDDSFPESNYVKWTKDKTSFGKANDQLKIDFQQTHRDDAGSYTCIVRNELGQARASLQLTVLYAPNVSVSLLKNGNILCNASGVPSVYIFSRWEHLSEFGTHIRYLDGSHDGILNISSGVDSVPYLNNGKYICTVQNGISDRFNKVNQTGYIFIQYQGRPFCLNVSGRTRANFDYEHMVTIKIAVEAFSISTYDTVEWLHGNKIIPSNHTRYKMVSSDTTIQTDIHGSYLVLISGYRFTLSFMASNNEDYGQYTMSISNINNTAVRRTYVQLKH
ncbi:unnamed protein product [Mytilus edulis]|uniref:Ig-like domain-containing protein n=1 Tax=Mytilus edulis TaxID=6550 RepID=A0A8S3SAG4_MYTED|nr:unnamed protein product [Mytilus edulis]